MANRKLFPGAVECITPRVMPAADVSNGAAAACAISIFNAMRRKSSCFSDHVACQHYSPSKVTALPNDGRLRASKRMGTAGRDVAYQAYALRLTRALIGQRIASVWRRQHNDLFAASEAMNARTEAKPPLLSTPTAGLAR